MQEEAATLEKCGANVRVISDRFSHKFDELEKSSICLEKKNMSKKILKACFLFLPPPIIRI